MASAEVAADAGQRDAAAASGSGLLSKLTRTPSRKHKPRPSSENTGLTDTNQSVTGAVTPKVRPRPLNQRTITAPSGTTVTLNSAKNESNGRYENNGVTHGSQEPLSRTQSANAITATMATPHPPMKSHPTPNIPDLPSQHGATMILQPVAVPVGAQNPHALYQHIHELSSKRMATLDYMRKAHEGRTYWFNTIQFNKSDLSKMPSYSPSRLSRRATNYMLLGMSVPAVLDIYSSPHPHMSATANANIAHDFLRNLNQLLAEFETYQHLHPTDGSTASTLSRARLPQMFKRATNNPRTRKSSGAVTEIGFPLNNNVSPPAVSESGHGHSHQLSLDTTYSNNTFASSATTLVASTPSIPSPATGFPAASAFPPPAPYDALNSTLVPNEGPYNYLLTPPLPFAPDFYTVFATLCDVLIDTYRKLLQLLNSPAVCTPSLSEMFTKADSRIRKVMVGGIIREFENASRENAKRELMGVQKVVLGGLMGN